MIITFTAEPDFALCLSLLSDSQLEVNLQILSQHARFLLPNPHLWCISHSALT